MAKTFDDLVACTSSRQVRERAKALARQYLAEMLLKEIRRLRGKSQKDLAAKLGIRQPSLSKLESQDDMHLSTLRKIVNALGGELVLVARFPDGQTELAQFTRRPAAARRRRDVA
jgi:transcriptional regulator with XRE-family HTH domain